MFELLLKLANWAGARKVKALDAKAKRKFDRAHAMRLAAKRLVAKADAVHEQAVGVLVEAQNTEDKVEGLKEL